ncbi:hypothetical protein [Aestuariibaculum lutulentum]|uniref:Uncharacterized protein n=1 Tax=Aestuariibaculum lutulentum TaxID=2920935 RepID=A0ABS9RG29_9FLAO|nr:hypothetical protein [Aestuariibaculum lutulentum]MCH4551901.1 hypothetical protein [Aestuariibaculum lutulentum]
MKLFPSKIFKTELRNDYLISMQNLKSNTDITDTLVSNHTNKAFRGLVDEVGFKIISSEIGRGAVCVLIGNFNGKTGEIEVRIHNAFKVMFSIILSYPFIGFGIISYTQGMEKGINFLPILLFGFLFIRFIFIGFGFRLISKTSINKLTEILEIIELNEK